MLNNEELVQKLAERVSDCGGRVYFVGGCVRDWLLNRENKDIDIEVYGITPEKLKEICSEFGRVDDVGVSFGILKVHGYDLDIAMPRSERLIGEGHKAFEVNVDPFMTTKEAAMRRDFTMNALMKDVLTGEIIDHFGGQEDIKNKVIRHIDDKTFIEDPLRVFRAAGFAARMNFTISDETLDLCKQIDVSTLSKERVFEETNKAFLKADHPSVYFKELRRMNQLTDFFPELKNLIGVQQDPTHHPEGDVWNHTMIVIDNAEKVRDEVSNPLGFFYASAFHDVGKAAAARYDEKKGRWTAIGHVEAGMPFVHNALKRLTNDRHLIYYVENMVSKHMDPHMMVENSSVKKTNRLLDSVKSPRDLIILAGCDAMSEHAIDHKLIESGWWDDRIRKYEEVKKLPEVTGDDLIALGYKPGPEFKKILNKCHDIHLAGVNKESLIKQIPSIVKSMRRKEREEDTVDQMIKEARNECRKEKQDDSFGKNNKELER